MVERFPAKKIFSKAIGVLDSAVKNYFFAGNIIFLSFTNKNYAKTFYETFIFGKGKRQYRVYFVADLQSEMGERVG